MSEYAITIDNLTKTYFPTGKGAKKTPEKQALKGINLTIPKGAFYGLLGPNGAGKSTLINIMAGLTLKTSGKIIIDGIDQDVDPRGTRFRIGVVPQEVILDPFFPVGELLEFYSGYYGLRKPQRRVQELLTALSLADKVKSTPRRLSGGMRRRVLIAKALVHNPPIIVLDEPTAGVDVELRRQLWDYVSELNRNGTTILLTTHYLEEAQELCDQIAIINHGQVIANDKTSNIMKLMDKKQLTITLHDTLREVPSAFTPFNGKLLDEHRLQLIYPPSKTGIEELLRHIQTAGLTIKDLSTEEPDLEDIFRHLVSEPETQRHAA